MKKGDKKEVSLKKQYFIRNIITFLDFLLAVLIIVCAPFIANDQFSRYSLIFGFVMLLITTIILVIQRRKYKWD